MAGENVKRGKDGRRGGERERGRGEQEREKGGWHSRPLATQTSERFSGSSVTT